MKGYKISTVLLAILSVVLFFSTIYYANNKKVEYRETVKRDTVVIHSIDTITIENNSISYRDIIILDTLYISDTSLVVEQKTYEDSISTIHFQGINAFIDYIEYRIPKDTIHIYTEKVQTVKEKDSFWKNRFVVTAGVYAGFSLISRQPDIYAGIGIGIRLF